MTDEDWFDDLPEDFEESVRIDREDRGKREKNHRHRAIETYHVTDDSRRFIGDFIRRLLGEADDMRSGSNYWMYGYYGSGKSHLLTVLDGLMDGEWVDGRRDEIWSDLVPESFESSEEKDSFEEIRDHWKKVHDRYHIIPVSVNLLKHQGQKQESLSEIVLRNAHRNPVLTGVNDGVSEGMSAQTDVAYFENWYRTTEFWPERQDLASEAVEELIPQSPRYNWGEKEDRLWKNIQRYSGLSDVVLPRLFEEATGYRSGYSDLQPSDIDPEEAISRLEELRKERESESGKETKLLLLLDEVSLFIGTDFDRLTELQTVAENVDDIGDGDIKLIATAQEKIEDARPDFAARGADFSIVKDRFPHRYQLPSKHVGDIAKRRIFQKSEAGKSSTQRVLKDSDIKPSESLVYNKVKQNTNPPLNEVDEDELVDFYPFLPYHAPIFLKILFNLRKEASDPSKSVFSGTARAILALMHGLLWEWIDEGKEDELVTLIDFYELVRPEFREILPEEVRVIEGDRNSSTDGSDSGIRGIADEAEDEDSSIEEFDLDVAKAVFLLRRVHDTVPMNEGNIAVAIMSDLNGESMTKTKNRVEDSLDRLQKYIRPTDEESKPRYRFARQGERVIYEDTEDNKETPSWEAILDSVDQDLWGEVTERLSIPGSVPYKDTGDEYPVSYSFSVDGHSFGTGVEKEGGLEVQIEVQGIRPDLEHRQSNEDNEETLYWEIDTEGIDDLRGSLVDWWALRAAVEDRSPPPAVEEDLENRAESVRSKIVSSMEKRGSTYKVKDRSDPNPLSEYVEEAVDVTYPDDFHPMMLQVDENRLQELSSLDADDPLPNWAHKIQVPSSGTGDNGTIQRNILALTGRQLKNEPDGLNLDTVLDGIVEQKPYYDEVRESIRAVLWGFCREGRLLPVDEEGNTVENDVLLTDGISTTRLKLLEKTDIGRVLEDHEFKDTKETTQEGLIRLREANETVKSKISDLQEDVGLTIEDEVHSEAVSSLLEMFDEELTEHFESAEQRLSVVKSQGDGLEDVVGETRKEQEWLENVSDTWERRVANIREWDIQLSLGDRRFEWVNEEALSAVDSRRETLLGYDKGWWIPSDWSDLIEELDRDVVSKLTESWNIFVDEQNLKQTAEKIDSSSWVLPATELPSEVHKAFESKYITPLRRFGQWYGEVEDAVDSLSEEDSEYDELIYEVKNLEPLSERIDIDTDELNSRMEDLSEVAESHSLDELEGVGILPADREVLDSRIHSLIEERDVSTEEVGFGVVVR